MKRLLLLLFAGLSLVAGAQVPGRVISIDKGSTGQRVYEDAISEKGGHTHNYEQAARQAYQDLSPKLSAIIQEQIRQ